MTTAKILPVEVFNTKDAIAILMPFSRIFAQVTGGKEQAPEGVSVPAATVASGSDNKIIQRQAQIKGGFVNALKITIDDCQKDDLQLAMDAHNNTIPKDERFQLIFE
jgi:hypothetical protein